DRCHAGDRHYRGLGLSAAGVAGRAGAAGHLPRIIPMRWAEQYIGLPFKDFGRDFNGVDCWGLVRLVLKRECDIEVPSYGEISARDLIVSKTIKQESSSEPWSEVRRNDVQAFDVALLRGRPMHVGIMISPELLLHVEEKTNAVLLPLTHFSVAGRLIGFRRHRDLICNRAA